jgi:tetratricopeptide (TPR) repeat protein
MRSSKYAIKAILLLLILTFPFLSNAREEQHMVRGAKAESQGDYKRAITEYELALSEDPYDVDLYLSVGNIYRFKLNDTDNAFRVYQKGLELMPHSFLLNKAIMYSYFEQKDLRNGIRYYKILAELTL